IFFSRSGGIGDYSSNRLSRNGGKIHDDFIDRSAYSQAGQIGSHRYPRPLNVWLSGAFLRIALDKFLKIERHDSTGVPGGEGDRMAFVRRTVLRMTSVPG